MKSRRFLPSTVFLLTAALGLAAFVAGPASAQDRDGGEKTEKKVYRFERGPDEEQDAGAGYLGVQVQALTSSLRRARNIPGSTEGALVNTVEDGSPAAGAGIKKGDVILEVDHKPTTDPSELIDVVRALEPATKVPVTLWRDGSRKTLTVTVGARPDQFEFQMPPMPGDDGPGGGPDGRTRMEVFRHRGGAMERQLRDIQDQLSRLREEDFARLERQIRELRAELREFRLNRNDRSRDENRPPEDRRGD